VNSVNFFVVVVAKARRLLAVAKARRAVVSSAALTPTICNRFAAFDADFGETRPLGVNHAKDQEYPSTPYRSCGCCYLAADSQ